MILYSLVVSEKFNIQYLLMNDEYNLLTSNSYQGGTAACITASRLASADPSLKILVG
jgi:hypothetical protein